MLGVEALGVFALGQSEPWTIKGKNKPQFVREGRGKQPDYSQDQATKPSPPKRVKKPKPYIPALPPPAPKPVFDPGVVVLMQEYRDRIEARRRDEEDAIALLLMTN